MEISLPLLLYTQEIFPVGLEFVEIPSTTTKNIQSLNSLIWKLKESNNPPKKRRDSMKALFLPQNMKNLEKDLKSYHNVENTTTLPINKQKIELDDGSIVFIEI